MSLILDALNRSQRERDIGNKVPGLEAQHTPESLPRSNNWNKILPWAGLVAALCVIAWLLWGGEEKVEAEAAVLPLAVASVPERKVAPPAVKKAEPVPQQAVQALVTKEPAGKKPADTIPTEQVSAVQALYKKQVEEKAPPPKVVKTLPVSGTEPVQQANIEQAIDIEEMVAAAKAEAKNIELSEHSAPFLSGLSQQSRDRVPTIYYTRHDYYGDSSQSTVTLNGETVRAGAKLAGSLRVEEILSDSVVLNHSGTQFRLRALNSWINL